MEAKLSSQSQNETPQRVDSGRNDGHLLEGLASLPFHQQSTIAIHDLQHRLAREIQNIETEDVTDE